MPYRQTATTRKNAEDKRDGLLRAARSLVAADGFKAATVAAIATRCQVSVGSVYSHFDSRDRLLAEVFRSAASHEIDLVRAAVSDPVLRPADRLAALIRMFSSRALNGRRMAWALLFEPVSPVVEAERLVYRRSYTDIGEQIISDGAATGAFRAPDARLAASAVMGAVAEALVGWIRPDSPQPPPHEQERVIEGIRQFCFQALGAPADDHPPSPSFVRGRKRTPTVQDVLLERRRTGDTGDGATVALVIEGGGMRGIVSAAMAAVIEREGLLSSVDLIVGTSAGAVNAAALAVGAAGAMAESYAEVFASPEFIDVRRIARGRPVIDGPRLVSRADELFGLGAAAESGWAGRLAVVATDVDTGRAEALTDFTGRADLMAAIHASGLLPMLAGDPVTVRGRRWLDGGIVEAVPVVSAAALGATHALVLATRPPGTQPVWGAADVVVERYLRRLNPELAAAYRGRPHRYREMLQQVRDGWSHGLSTLALTPRLGDPLPGRLERDQIVLRAARAAAEAAVHEQLGFLLGEKP